VLARPEFLAERWRGDALRQWLAGWWERLTALLGTTAAEQWAGLGRAVFLSAAAVGLLLLWRALRRRRAGAGTPARRRDLEAVSWPVAEPVSVADAERALAAGDAAQAVRLAFLAAIALVGPRLPASAISVLTGSELAERIADDRFGRLARLHERTVFGRRPVTSEEAAAAVAVASMMSSGPAAGRTPGRPEVAT
jgi:hypothetical protein